MKSLTRNIRRGSVGVDVRYVKEALFTLGYLKKTPTHNLFGSDTRKAVIDFQAANKDIYGVKLDQDGVVGELTFGAIRALLAGSPTDILKYADFPNISKAVLDAINKDLKFATDIRVKMVQNLLPFAFDNKSVVKQPSSLYVFGANLYNPDLTLNVATEKYIRKRAAARPQYFTGGRLEWMIKQANSRKICCADCSGAIVGSLRKEKLVKASFDTTANNFCSNRYSSKTTKSALLPGDFVGRPGHIGVYVGGGEVLEFVGGAYTCQLTKLNNRKARNFVKNTMDSFGGWATYRTPIFY